MRVIHTINSLRADHGGPSRSVTELCTALADQGTDVRIVTQNDREGDGAASVQPAGNVPVTFVPRQAAIPGIAPAFSRFASALTREIAQRQTTANGQLTNKHRQLTTDHEQLTTDYRQPANPIIHDHGLWMPSNHIAASVARRNRCRFVVSTRGMLTEWALARKRIRKRAAWAVYQRKDLSCVAVFHATSEGEVGDVRRSGLRQPVAVIPNGVTIPDVWKTTPCNGSRRQALFLSRVHPIKGVIDLVQAWGRIRPEGWSLTLAGPLQNGFRGEIEATIRKLEMDEEITVSGPVTDVEKWPLYRRADLFILPTLSESFGIAVAEALASGVPVITTKAAPWAEIQSRRCGWWVDTGAESLATAIKEATGLSDERRLEMGRRGRELIVEKYAWERAAGEMAAVYRWLYGREPRPENVFT